MNLEYIPPNTNSVVYLPFLNATSDNQTDNLYPYVHLLPNGTLFMFANRDSIIYDYITNTVVSSFPSIPGEPRNYPSGGSSVMLPLLATNQFSVVEVLICGGAQFGAYLNPAARYTCSVTCGRIVVTDVAPNWAMETMPMPRCMGDMIILPSRDVIIINGAQQGMLLSLSRLLLIKFIRAYPFSNGEVISVDWSRYFVYEATRAHPWKDPGPVERDAF